MPATPTQVPAVPVVNARVSPELYAAALNEATRRQCSVSDVVREALVKHLDFVPPAPDEAVPA